MYHASTSLLARIGLQSKDHATTVAVLEHFFGKQIERELIEKFNGLKERMDRFESVIIEDKYINYLWKVKNDRETAQYGISIKCSETEVIIRIARDFASKIKIVQAEMAEDIINVIVEKIAGMKKEAEFID